MLMHFSNLVEYDSVPQSLGFVRIEVRNYDPIKLTTSLWQSSGKNLDAFYGFL